MAVTATVHSDGYITLIVSCLKIMQMVHLVTVEPTNQPLQNPCNIFTTLFFLNEEEPIMTTMHLKNSNLASIVNIFPSLAAVVGS